MYLILTYKFNILVRTRIVNKYQNLISVFQRKSVFRNLVDSHIRPWAKREFKKSVIPVCLISQLI
jgi:hypothetical protein